MKSFIKIILIFSGFNSYLNAIIIPIAKDGVGNWVVLLHLEKSAKLWVEFANESELKPLTQNKYDASTISLDRIYKTDLGDKFIYVPYIKDLNIGKSGKAVWDLDEQFNWIKVSYFKGRSASAYRIGEQGNTISTSVADGVFSIIKDNVQMAIISFEKLSVPQLVIAPAPFPSSAPAPAQFPAPATAPMLQQFQSAFNAFLKNSNPQTFDAFKVLWDQRKNANFSAEDLEKVEKMGLMVNDIAARQAGRLKIPIQLFIVSERDQLIIKIVGPLLKQLKDIDAITDDQQKMQQTLFFFNKNNNFGGGLDKLHDLKNELIRALVNNVGMYYIGQKDLGNAKVVQSDINDYKAFLEKQLLTTTYDQYTNLAIQNLNNAISSLERQQVSSIATQAVVPIPAQSATDLKMALTNLRDSLNGLKIALGA